VSISYKKAAGGEGSPQIGNQKAGLTNDGKPCAVDSNPVFAGFSRRAPALSQFNRSAKADDLCQENRVVSISPDA
jgi:hypothetical protein